MDGVVGLGGWGGGAPVTPRRPNAATQLPRRHRSRVIGAVPQPPGAKRSRRGWWSPCLRPGPRSSAAGEVGVLTWAADACAWRDSAPCAQLQLRLSAADAADAVSTPFSGAADGAAEASLVSAVPDARPGRGLAALEQRHITIVGMSCMPGIVSPGTAVGATRTRTPRATSSAAVP